MSDDRMKITVKFSGADSASQEAAAKAMDALVKAVDPTATSGAFIHCDGCGVRHAHPQIDGALQSAEDAGWATNQPGGEDFCPKCKEEREL